MMMTSSNLELQPNLHAVDGSLKCYVTDVMRVEFFLLAYKMYITYIPAESKSLEAF